MKKRCTNSSCRKVFRTEYRKCPHCGKEYPRASIDVDDFRRFGVVLTCLGPSLLRMVRAIHTYTGLSLKDAKACMDNYPSVVSTGITLLQAEALKAEIRAAGGDAMIIPASRGTRGIFVLPKKAG